MPATLARTGTWSREGPLSPLLAAVFVDDTYFFSRDSSVLRHAKRLSDEYDEAFGFFCEDDKCQIATADGDRIGPILASMWGYKLSSSLMVLGIIGDFNER